MNNWGVLSAILLAIFFCAGCATNPTSDVTDRIKNESTEVMDAEAYKNELFHDESIDKNLNAKMVSPIYKDSNHSLSTDSKRKIKPEGTNEISKKSNDDKKKYTYESPMEGFDPKCHLPEGDPVLWAEFLKSKGYDVKKPHDLYTRKNPKDGEGYIYKAWEVPTEHSDTTFLANEVIRDLEDATSPFFYHISFLRPHPPMFVSEPWHSLINPNEIELPKETFNYEELLNQHPFLKEMARKFLNEDSYKEIRYKDLKDQDKKNIIAVYLGMCAEVDHNIGRILKSLEKNNLEKNTLIIFTSDHGELLGENRMWGKLGWWDSAYRIPLIIHKF